MYGQVVIGPPGSGKTTYCRVMKEFLTNAFNRKVAIINMDPANDILPYKPDVDISELVTLSDVMDNLHLGPNGGLVFTMDYIYKNIDWLEKKLEPLKEHYLLFDFPGQVELYTHDSSVRNIVARLVKSKYKLVAVHLVDSHYCSDASKFISVLLTSLATMLQVELPHVNVLSKADLIEKFGKLSFNIDYYTEVLDLSYLLNELQDDPFFRKRNKMNEAIVGVVEDYSLVSFVLLNIQDKDCMLRVTKSVDKANGYIFGDEEERNIQSLLSCAVGAEFEDEKISKIREKYVKDEKMEDDEEETDKIVDFTI